MGGTYFYTFKTSRQIGHTCVGSQKQRWPMATHSLNQFLLELTRETIFE